MTYGRRLGWFVLALIAVMAILRFWWAQRMELLPEEAYYWTYWKHPALSYFDHPPMVAWVIGLGTFCLGDTEFGTRLGFNLLSLMSTALVYGLGRIWFGRRAGAWAAVLFAVIPLYIGTGLLAFPDGPLIFFWLATMYAVTKAIDPLGRNRVLLGGQHSNNRRAWFWWSMAGVTFGGAMLSKYTAILLGVSLLIFLLMSPAYRHWLRRPQPWVAVVVAFLVFSPVLVWNSQNSWASFIFQTSRTAEIQDDAPEDVAKFWLTQLAILTPVVFVLLGCAAAQGVRSLWKRTGDGWSFAACFSAPLFMVFVYTSFKREVNVNWTAPAFLSLLPVVGAMLAASATSTGHRWRRWASVFTMGTVIVVVLLAATSAVFGWPHILHYGGVGGWREFAEKVESAEHDLLRETGQEPFILGMDKYNISALLSFYTREPEEQINTYALGYQGLGFRYWTDLQSFEGKPAIAVLIRTNRAAFATLTTHFQHFDPPVSTEVQSVGEGSHKLYLARCYGYRPLLAQTARQTIAGSRRSVHRTMMESE
jgi:dolichol-phosphate mannosyltransferase